MTFNIHQLDNLPYDDAESLLDDYMDTLMGEFVESESGKAHIKKYPEGGYWIGTFIEMGFNYGGKTLPKMTQRDVKTLMEQTFPRKLILLDPKDMDDAIPELVAFWGFLQDDYKLRHAGPIRKYLRSIHAQFRKWMFDDSRGGFTKNLMMQGMDAGFDMTSQEGLDAFKEIYNQQLNQQQPKPSKIITPDNPFPDRQDQGELGIADVQALMEMMQDVLPPELAGIDPAALIKSVLADELLSSLGSSLSPEPPEPPIARQALATGTNLGRLLENASQPAETLSSTAHREADLFEIATLEAQAITETEPGTILSDFQNLLDFIAAEDVPVSGKTHQFSQKLFADINQRLSKPIDIDLKRPVQKSYPNIHGLYLLLRASRLAIVEIQGKTAQLKLNPPVYDQWQQLNPTERYFTLLEAWLVRGNPEILAEERFGGVLEGECCLRGWDSYLSKDNPALTPTSYKEQQSLNFWPKLYNLALMELFGFIEITTDKPEPGKGWRFKKVTPLPLGDAVLALFKNTFVAGGLVWQSEQNPAVPLNELQAAFQPYFPDWQRYLTFEESKFRPDLHIFKVSLGKVWRKLAIGGEANLYDLSLLILESVDFDNDHLHCFTYQNEAGQKVQIYHPYYEYGFFERGPQMPPSDEVKIGDLPLKIGDTMEYLFDFGDDWEFKVQLEALEPLPLESKKSSKSAKNTQAGQLQGKVLASRGKSPEQYPHWE